MIHFLDAPSHFYKRVCPSVRPSIRPSVGPSLSIKAHLMSGIRPCLRITRKCTKQINDNSQFQYGSMIFHSFLHLDVLPASFFFCAEQNFQISFSERFYFHHINKKRYLILNFKAHAFSIQ